ncbi:MAG: Ryanodine receptor Ryr [Bacilli bacterium]|nr:Ryanodine receptor Ryr [Bacilli bacterium]
MTKKKYVPHPVDTSTVKLDQDLLDLTEVIAENVHEVWSASRIKEGWTYGEQKDSVKKTTPCLVPYDELPEIEKQYDRDTAFETIKLIIKLGYKINK